MEKSIEELKDLVVDGTIIKLRCGIENVVERFPNNVIKINGEMISWRKFREALIVGDYELLDPDTREVIVENGKKWGGARVPGPGKKIGAPKKAEKKKTVSFSLDAVSIEIIEQFAREQGIKKSEALSLILVDFQGRK